MEKAIKQRLLGGLVLVAGAALFLPMLLDGAGSQLTVPPMPAAPQVPALEQVAPKLDAEVAKAEQSINAAQEDSTFVDKPDESAALEADVSADAAAAAVNTTAPAVAKPVPDKAATDKAAAEKLAQEKALAAQAKAAQEKAALDKAAQEKAAQEKARLAAEAARKAADVKAAAAKTAASQPAASSAALPQAWVVQVASLSAKDKADALVKKLRQKNFRAVAQQQGAVWKVIVGPELRREMAESIQSRIKADPDIAIAGFIQPYKP